MVQLNEFIENHDLFMAELENKIDLEITDVQRLNKHIDEFSDLTQEMLDNQITNACNAAELVRINKAIGRSIGRFQSFTLKTSRAKKAIPPKKMKVMVASVQEAERKNANIYLLLSQIERTADNPKKYGTDNMPRVSESFERMGSLYVYRHSEDYADSAALLRRNGLRFMTYKEALAHAPELIKYLKGQWFWLSDDRDSLNVKDGIYTFTNDGELHKIVGNEDPAKKVHVFAGNQPPLVNIHGDLEAWFSIDMDSRKDQRAPIVVGISALSGDKKMPILRH